MTTKHEAATHPSDKHAAEERVYGKNPPRDASGKPMEKGHGSAYQKAQATSRAYHHAASLSDQISAIQSAMNSLSGAVANLAAAHKDLVTHSREASDVAEREKAEAERAEAAA